jgi:hypothetical protein
VYLESTYTNFWQQVFRTTNSSRNTISVVRYSNVISDVAFSWSSGIAWSGSDTFGFLLTYYDSPQIVIAGGNSAASQGALPNWSCKLTLPTSGTLVSSTDFSYTNGILTITA